LALECDRWFDIVRTNQFEVIYNMIPAYRKLYPVPQEELENVYDPTDWQNDGYTL
jgi:mannose/fructose/N-acetylgalactosamine-specific phosphotransferase system component IID